jgi:hypothetical protein
MQSQTASQALLTLVFVAVFFWTGFNWMGMTRQTRRLTTVVVAVGPLAHNTAIASGRLKYRIRRVPTDRRPVQRIADAEGRFVSGEALKRCEPTKCAELLLMQEDLLDRPQLPDTDVFKATLNSPWTASDFAVGDLVSIGVIRTPPSSSSPRGMKVVALGTGQSAVVYVTPSEPLEAAVLDELRANSLRVLGLRR